MQLEYKAQLYGQELIKIDQYIPSYKGFSHRSHVVEKLSLNIRHLQKIES